MGFLDKAKGLLPPSSRSFHQMFGELVSLRNDLSWRIHMLSEKTAVQVDEMHERIERMDKLLNAHDVQMKMFAWEAYRRNGESLDEAKRRFFSEMPPAKGGLRMLQLGCTQLLHEFDDLCRDHGLRYWIAFGTLLGAERHGGFIPWDDDIDLGMMRGDIRKLREIVEESDRYRVSVVYDRFVHCRQVRFRYSDLRIPCFLDLFIFDYAKQEGEVAFEAMKADRACMISSLKADPDLAFWYSEDPYVDASSSEAAAIACYFDGTVDAEYATDGRLTWDEGAATSIVWGVDNVDDFNGYDWYCPVLDVLPPVRVAFEGVSCNAPANHRRFLDGVYGDIYELPTDLRMHAERSLVGMPTWSLDDLAGA